MNVEVDDALERCEQPDALIQLAWDAGLDKKTVIREGSDAAALLLAGEWNSMIELFWPVPRPLEAVDRWIGNSHPVTGTDAELRPFASAVVPGTLLGSLVTHFLVAPWLTEDVGLMALVGLIVAANAVVGVLFKVMIAGMLRRQVARLDEESALSIVLDQIRAGMAAHPPRVPRAVTRARKEFQKLMQRVEP